MSVRNIWDPLSQVVGEAQSYWERVRTDELGRLLGQIWKALGQYWDMSGKGQGDNTDKEQFLWRTAYIGTCTALTRASTCCLFQMVTCVPTVVLAPIHSVHAVGCIYRGGHTHVYVHIRTYYVHIMYYVHTTYPSNNRIAGSRPLPSLHSKNLQSQQLF